MTDLTALPLSNLLACIDKLVRLSMEHAPTMARHEAMAGRLTQAEADAEDRDWMPVRAGLNACIADVRMFEAYKSTTAEIATSRAMALLYAALGYVDECEMLDAIAAAPNVVRISSVRALGVLLGRGAV